MRLFAININWPPELIRHWTDAAAAVQLAAGCLAAVCIVGVVALVVWISRR